MNVLLRWTMTRYQRHQDFCIRGADCPRIAVGKIDAAIRQPYIIQYRIDFVARNFLPDLLVNLINQSRGLLDSQPGAAAEMKTKLSSVNAREEISTQGKYQCARDNAKSQKACHERTAMPHDHFKCAAIRLA